MRRAFVVAVAAIASVLAIGEAHAAVRFALVVGANHGRARDPELQFAEDDATRVAGILTALGGFQQENVILLKKASAGDLDRALDAALERVKNTAGETMFFVYYSGHADGEALNMNGTRFELETLREKLISATARTRVLVLDACHAGVLTRVKGGVASPEFSLELGVDRVGAEGFAIVASSAAGEEAQESDELGASFFTHYFVSALAGAGDADGDRRVTLAEAFAYSSERTLRATTPTAAGPQHPTYKVELKGREDVVLTELGRDSLTGAGVLELRGPGRFLIARTDPSSRGLTEIELGEGENKPVALDAGRYSVTQRQRDYVLVGEFEVVAGASKRIGEDELERVAFARVVRKGGTELSTVMSAFLTGGVRSPLFDLGPSWQGTLGVRWDLRSFAVEARISGGASSHQNQRIDVTTRELSFSFAGMRGLDVSALTANFGLELGVAQLAQRFGEPTSSHISYGAFAAPIALVEFPLGRASVRAELSLPAYLTRTHEIDLDGSVQRSLAVTIAARGTLGFGFYF